MVTLAPRIIMFRSTPGPGKARSVEMRTAGRRIANAALPLAGASVLLAASLACEPIDSNAGVEGPDTVPDATGVEPAGREAARLQCRDFVQRNAPAPADLSFQGDAKVIDLGGGRYRVHGEALLPRESADEARPRAPFECVMRRDEAEGWVAERVEVRGVE